MKPRKYIAIHLWRSLINEYLINVHPGEEIWMRHFRRAKGKPLNEVKTDAAG